METRLALTATQHQDLLLHLFPGDGLEAAAIALCGRACSGDRRRLVVHRIHPIPYGDCEREVGRIRWNTASVVPLLEEVARRGMAIIKIHSHPTGYDQFSDVDDANDRQFFASVYGWFDDDEPHASAVMLPSGRIFARTVQVDGSFVTVPLVARIGDDLDFWFADESNETIPEYAQRSVQAFGEGTYRTMRRLRFAVAGASGTGAFVIEQLVRSHAGSVVAIDPDRVEDKNLNRIPHTTIRDAKAGIEKVLCLAKAALSIGFEVEFIPIIGSLDNPEVMRAVSTADVAFGCMDTVDGRALLNRACTFYIIPYFDVGVTLDADGRGGVNQISGAIHYLQPGRSSFFTRGVFTSDEVFAAAMKRRDPEEYRKRVKAKYIRGVREDRPAVMPLNIVFAGLVVMEFLARLHRFRSDDNADYAYTLFGLSQGIYDHGPEAADCPSLARYVGRGDMLPLLDMPDFTEVQRAA